jgi:hypothetical protein
VPAGLSALSTPAIAAVFGLMRRFCSASLTIRRRSACGLKSTPKRVPDNAVAKTGPICVAAPVTAFSR